MSFPTKDAIFGKIVYKNREYSILNIPLTKKDLEKIEKYLKDNNFGYSSATWKSFNFEWLIEDEKLYLINFKSNYPNRENLINQIFNTNKLFVSFSGEIKLVESKKIIKRINEYSVMKERKIFTLTFNNGILCGESETISEEYLVLNFDFEEK